MEKNQSHYSPTGVSGPSFNLITISVCPSIKKRGGLLPAAEHTTTKHKHKHKLENTLFLKLKTPHVPESKPNTFPSPTPCRRLFSLTRAKSSRFSRMATIINTHRIPVLHKLGGFSWPSRPTSDSHISPSLKKDNVESPRSHRSAWADDNPR